MVTENNIPSCTNYDVSGTNWSLSGSTRLGGSDQAAVTSGVFRYQDVDEEVCLDYGTLNISGVVGDFSIEVTVTNSGGLESSDFIRLDYSIDGGPISSVNRTGDFAGILSETGLTGSQTLNLSVCADNNANSEFYEIDNIRVTPSGGTVVLPVELLFFDAEVMNYGVQLSWATASELNHESMIIERSIDGREFESIGEIKGEGNTQSLSNYQFMDYYPESGKNYYRLRQIDLDGSEAIFNVVSVQWEDLQNVAFQFFS